MEQKLSVVFLKTLPSSAKSTTCACYSPLVSDLATIMLTSTCIVSLGHKLPVHIMHTAFKLNKALQVELLRGKISVPIKQL